MVLKRKQFGLTLTEMIIVIAGVVLFAVLGVPAIRTLFDSLVTSGGTRNMISAGLATARAIAAKEQRYAGIRFQKAYHPDGPLEADQYMIFIVQDPKLGTYFFRAVDGVEPIKLPKETGIMDFTIVVARKQGNPADPHVKEQLDDPLQSDVFKDNLLNSNAPISDTTTFSIIFSPAGKLVVHGVRVRNRDGYQDTPSNTGYVSMDDIFNKKLAVDQEIAMFYQDDYFDSYNDDGELGFGPEASRSRFIIYERAKLKEARNRGAAWSDYLSILAGQEIFINAYTGRMILTD